MSTQKRCTLAACTDERTGMMDRVLAVVYRLFPVLASWHTCRELHIQVGEVYASVEVVIYPQHGIQQWTVFSDVPFRLSNLHGEDDGDAVSRDGDFYTSTIVLPIDVIPLIVAGQEVLV